MAAGKAVPEPGRGAASARPRGPGRRSLAGSLQPRSPRRGCQLFRPRRSSVGDSGAAVQWRPDGGAAGNDPAALCSGGMSMFARVILLVAVSLGVCGISAARAQEPDELAAALAKLD